MSGGKREVGRNMFGESKSLGVGLEMQHEDEEDSSRELEDPDEAQLDDSEEEEAFEAATADEALEAEQEEIPIDEGGDSAVEVSPYLREALRAYGKLSAADPASIYWRDDYCFTYFRDRLKNFCDAVVDAMGALPTSPGWTKTSDEEVNALRSAFIRVYRSYVTAKRLLRIGVTAATVRAKVTGKVVPTHSASISRYISGYEPHAKYEAVRAWLFRRTPAYIAFRKEYLARPTVREAMRKRRPSPAAERERKRIAYWRAKGLDAPPRRPSTKRDDAILAQHTGSTLPSDASVVLAAPPSPASVAEPSEAPSEPKAQTDITDDGFADLIANI